ncbi:hypothetical protein LZ32DRAFT_68425 [Colletotrichum eremochloae]|nr:hypothetical protein LZ32DRAFT_68425 [Colletotrichum eremochloae]
MLRTLLLTTTKDEMYLTRSLFFFIFFIHFFFTFMFCFFFYLFFVGLSLSVFFFFFLSFFSPVQGKALTPLENCGLRGLITVQLSSWLNSDLLKPIPSRTRSTTF